MPNEYSATWFALFLQPIQRSQTESEIAFIVRHLPRPHYTSVVDLCCGTGRHARLLVARGYRMLGMDRDTAALEETIRFRCLVACTGFDEEKLPSPASPRMQFVLEKKD